MNWASQRAVWDHSKARGSSRLVLAAIADFADGDDGWAWPALDKLAVKIRLSVRQTCDILKKLEQSGELFIEHSTGGRNRRSRYKITITNPVTGNTVVDNTVSGNRVKPKTVKSSVQNSDARRTRNTDASFTRTKVSILTKTKEIRARRASADRRPLRPLEKIKEWEAECRAEQQARRKVLH